MAKGHKTKFWRAHLRGVEKAWHQVDEHVADDANRSDWSGGGTGGPGDRSRGDPSRSWCSVRLWTAGAAEGAEDGLSREGGNSGRGACQPRGSSGGGGGKADCNWPQKHPRQLVL